MIFPPIVVFFIIFSLLVLVHELGHFFAAKKAGIKIEEFGFGFPPKLVSIKYGGTIYSLNLLPLGGFVRLYGEEGEIEKGGECNRAFFAQSKKKRLVVLLAGVFANFLLSIACFSFIYTSVGIPTETNKVIIAGIAPNSPAEKAGFEAHDRVLFVDNEEVFSIEEFQGLIEERKGKEVLLKVERNIEKEREEKEFRLVPRIDPPQEEGAMGVALTSIEMVFYPFWQMPFRAAFVGIKEAIAWGGMVVSGLLAMIGNLFVGQLPQDVAGPVGIYQLTTGVAQQGLLIILQFIGVLSINLAVLNVAPFPALDGGRILFVILEKVIGKRVKPKIEQITHMAGMALLVSLMVLVTIKDLSRFQPISDFFQKISSFLPFL